MTAITFIIKRAMPRRSVFVTVGNICEDFANDLKCVSNGIILRYYAKKRSYGCKVIICAKDRITDKTIVYSLIKLRSIADIDILDVFLSGMSEFLHRYYNKSASSDTDSQ